MFSCAIAVGRQILKATGKEDSKFESTGIKGFKDAVINELAFYEFAIIAVSCVQVVIPVAAGMAFKAFAIRFAPNFIMTTATALLSTSFNARIMAAVVLNVPKVASLLYLGCSSSSRERNVNDLDNEIDMEIENKEVTETNPFFIQDGTWLGIDNISNDIMLNEKIDKVNTRLAKKTTYAFSKTHGLHHISGLQYGLREKKPVKLTKDMYFDLLKTAELDQVQSRADSLNLRTREVLDTILRLGYGPLSFIGASSASSN